MAHEITELDRRFGIFKRAEESYQEELARVRNTCKHPNVGEWKDREDEELRICLDCGAEEGGWGCGFTVLGPRRRTVKILTEDEFYAQRKPGKRHLVGRR